MNRINLRTTTTPSPDEGAVRTLYKQLLDGWNNRDAAAYAGLMTPDGSVVGFDGSMMNGQAEIESTIAQIFADHITAAYVGKVREVRFLQDSVALLRAVAGLVPRGQSQVNPAANSIQSMVAVKQDGEWRVAHFHNTPAQFHGRPELAQQLTDELNELIA